MYAISRPSRPRVTHATFTSFKPPSKPDGTQDWGAPRSEWTTTTRVLAAPVPPKREDPKTQELEFHRIRRDHYGDGYLAATRKNGTIIEPSLRRYELRDTRQRRERDLRLIREGQEKMRRMDAAAVETAKKQMHLDAEEQRRASVLARGELAQPSHPTPSEIPPEVIRAAQVPSNSRSRGARQQTAPALKASTQSQRQGSPQMSATAGVKKSKAKPKTKAKANTKAKRK